MLTIKARYSKILAITLVTTTKLSGIIEITNVMGIKGDKYFMGFGIKYLL